MDLASLGFDPALLAHATASLPIYSLALAFAKRMQALPKKHEMLVALALTSSISAGIAMAQETAQLFPVLSSSTTGAMLAMIVHSQIFGRKEEP